ncbi:hypothetical protein AMTR_s00082p00079590 [Amborella trichopoda]|uniref:Uncharacterized protein n=1 Tax=Amborella trichopoda TaxID=13333 RepID=W1NSI9_AMBTC|nr:hypothetical protein AMTR_s00082p00079590 [Amborella trichopoda]
MRSVAIGGSQVHLGAKRARQCGIHGGEHWGAHGGSACTIVFVEGTCSAAACDERTRSTATSSKGRARQSE